MDLHAILKTITNAIHILASPEGIALLSAVGGLLVRSKIIHESDVAVAKDILIAGEHLLDSKEGVNGLISGVTDVTKLKKPQVENIAREIKAQLHTPDTNKKKISRALRSIVRGWIS